MWKYFKRCFGINDNLALLIFKIDYYQPGSSVPIIGYEVYHPVNKSKLDLNYFKNSSINLNIPVSINFYIFILRRNKSRLFIKEKNR